MALITITSDIGQHDFLVGAVKGQLLKISKDFTIIDITHQLSPFNFTQAAYVCKNAIKNFPFGTFHLVLVNLFDTIPQHLLLAEHNGHFIGCADNGFLTMILDGAPQKVVALTVPQDLPKSTLSLTAVFGKAFAAISDGRNIEEVGDSNISIKIKNPLVLIPENDWIEGQIIFIDNFENVVVNITKGEFERQRKGRNFKIVFRRDEVIEKISETYADVPHGEKLAIFNSANYLEIAINKGNASSLFGLKGFSEIQNGDQSKLINNRLFYQTVKVFFE